MNHASNQPSLLEYQPPLPIEATDRNIDPSDQTRLRGQNLAILKRLLSGPATNNELSKISLKYTSRISDVRAWLERSGSTIECQRGEGGLNTYAIVTAAHESRDTHQRGGSRTPTTVESQIVDSMPDQITCPRKPKDQHGKQVVAGHQYRLSIPGRESMQVVLFEDPEDGVLYMRAISTGRTEAGLVARVDTSNPGATWESLGKADSTNTAE